MSTSTRDLSVLNLEKGESADIHSTVSWDGVFIATVHVEITVLEAEDGNLILSVDQNTSFAPTQEIRTGLRRHT